MADPRSCTRQDVAKIYNYAVSAHRSRDFGLALTFYQEILDRLASEDSTAVLAAVPMQDGGVSVNPTEYDDVILEQMPAEHSHLLCHVHLQMALILRSYTRDLPAARQHLDEAVATRPSYAPAHYALALLLEAEGGESRRGALEHLQRTVKLDPLFVQARVKLAKLLSCSAFWDPEAAIRHLKAAIAADENSAEAHFRLGYLLTTYKGEDRAALTHLTKALNISPNNSNYHKHIAYAYKKLELYDDAVAHFERSLVDDPDNAEVHAHLALIYDKNLANFDKTRLHLERAIECDPVNETHQMRLGQFYELRLKKYADAKQCYWNALEINSSNDQARVQLAGIEVMRLNNPTGALEILNPIMLSQAIPQAGHLHAAAACIELNRPLDAVIQFDLALQSGKPLSSPLLMTYANLLSEHTNRYQDASMLLQRAADADPTDMKVQLALVACLQDQLHDTERAYHALTRLHDAMPDNPIVNARLAAIYDLKLNDAEKAIALYRQAERLRSSDAGVVCRLAVLTSRRAPFTAASQEIIEKALSRFPRNIALLFEYAEFMLHVKNEPDAALAALKRIISIDAEVADAHYQCGVIEYELHHDCNRAAWFLRDAVLYDPRHVDARILLASVEMSLSSNVAQALIHLRAALDVDPHHVKALIECASLEHSDGQHTSAIEHYRTLVTLQPNPEWSFRLGMLLCDHTTAYKEALEQLKLAVSGNFNASPATYSRIQSLMLKVQATQ